MTTTKNLKVQQSQPSQDALEVVPKDYKTLLEDLKSRISSAQIKAALSVNRELILLYWSIGQSILEKQEKAGWGTKIVERLSKDLKNLFPGMKGFSLTNLKYMMQFAKEYPDFPISQQPVGQIPWGHNILLLQKLDNVKERLWYAQNAIEHGWSRNVLWHWIDSRLFDREGKAITNFQRTLPAPQSDLAHQTLKDPYSFDFLMLCEKHDERELEDGLIEHVQRFLTELGHGFAFMGRQYPLQIAGDTYSLDLLFYHTKLHCYVVVELKAGSFDPRDAGQMNFYLSAVDDILRTTPDNPTIGLLLCKDKNGLKAEYALRDIHKPIGISTYETQIVKSLPKDLRSSLPTIEEIEAELEHTP